MNTAEPPQDARPRLVGIALYALALGAALAIGPRGPVYWDSSGYVAQALTGRVGGLALGRPVFVLVSHAIVSLFLRAHGSPWSLEPLLRFAWLPISALAAPSTWDLARRCGASERASVLAGLAVAFSPAFAHTSGVVLTDAPAVAVSTVALALAARAVGASTRGIIERPSASFGLAAGACVGLAFGLREQSIVTLVPMALMLFCAPRAARLRVGAAMAAGALGVAAIPIAFVAHSQPGWWPSVRGWLRAMRLEDATHRYAWTDFLAFLAWLVALSPATVAAAIPGWVRAPRPLLRFPGLPASVCLPALVQLALLARYPDIAYSPRYLLPTLPGALAIPAAFGVERMLSGRPRRAAIASALLVLPTLFAVPIVRAYEAPLVHVLNATPGALAPIAAQATIVTGEPCNTVSLVQAIRRYEHGPSAAQWETICPGWSWPRNLGSRLDAVVAQRRTIVLDLREDAWLGAGQRARRDEAVRWLSSTRADVIVWR